MLHPPPTKTNKQTNRHKHTRAHKYDEYPGTCFQLRQPQVGSQNGCSLFCRQFKFLFFFQVAAAASRAKAHSRHNLVVSRNTTIFGNTHDIDLLEKNQINTLPKKINWAHCGERALARAAARRPSCRAPPVRPELPRTTGSRPNPLTIFFIFIFRVAAAATQNKNKNLNSARL